VTHGPDVLIVGAGPAGSTTAVLLARQGWDVLLVDRKKFPRGKACGEFLNPGAVALLRRLGLLDPDLERQGAAIGHWALRSGTTMAHGRFPASLCPGLGIPRRELDQRLIDYATEAGATFRDEVSFESLGDNVVLRMGNHRETLSPKLVVGAGGLRCPVAARIGRPSSKNRRRRVSLSFHVTAGPENQPPLLGLRLGTSSGAGTNSGDGTKSGEQTDLGSGLLAVRGSLTVGAVPLSADGSAWNVTVVADSTTMGRTIAEDPRAFLRRAIDSTGGGAAVDVVGGPWGSGPFDRTMMTVHRHGAVLVGDAAGFYDPFTGQGMYQAIRSAELVAPHAHNWLSGATSNDEAFSSYQERLFVERRRTRTVQRSVEWALGSTRRQRLSLTLLRVVPGILNNVLSFTGDTLPQREVRS